MHLNNSGATAPFVLQAGRCAAMSVTSEPTHDEAGHLCLRTIARALGWAPPTSTGGSTATTPTAA